MNDEGLTAFDLEQEVLAPPGQRADPPAGEPAQLPPVERLAQRRDAHLDALDRPPGEPCLQAAFQHFDFGELGHRGILATSRRGGPLDSFRREA